MGVEAFSYKKGFLNVVWVRFTNIKMVSTPCRQTMTFSRKKPTGKTVSVNRTYAAWVSYAAINTSDEIVDVTVAWFFGNKLWEFE